MERYAPSEFGTIEFAADNKQHIKKYIEYRVHGYHPHVAFRRVFGEENMCSQSHVSIELLEHNEYYKEHFERRLKEIKIEDLWNTKTSIHELLSMTRNVFAKDTTRLNAMKELNVLVGITVVDENGKTKAGRSLDDFYRGE
jgi:ASC-1-like (ASCH) protein